ncbi:MAG: XRE family transcriptional regulator [Bacteroidota bacterium]
MKKVAVSPTQNIFEVLGRRPDEAANLLIRSRLMGEIKQYIIENKLSLRKAAALFDVAHPRISDLMQGRIDKFGIDYLVNLLAKIGKSVTVQVESTKDAPATSPEVISPDM